jgi:hypothetical protein
MSNNSAVSGEVGPSPGGAVGAPFEISPTSGEARILGSQLKAVEERLSSSSAKLDQISGISSDIKHIQSDVNSIKSNAREDHRWLLTVFASGFLLLAGLFIYGYNRLGDKIDRLEALSTKIDVKMEDFISRTLPAQPPNTQKRPQ